MTEEQVLNSINLKKRFCKDYNLPIAVYDNPYFYERLSTLDLLFDCLKGFKVFCKELEQYSNEQDYFEHYNTVKENAINFIKDQPSFIKFNNETDKRIANNIPKKDIYIEENDDCAFISIDMKQANFSALNHYSAEIFDNCGSWENFVSKFTNNIHIIHSKYIRQVILGACNPGKQIHYEKYLMYKLYTYLKEKYPQIVFYSLNNDEIIIKIDKPQGFSLDNLKQTVLNNPEGIGSLVKVEYFHLNKIPYTKGWIKRIDSSDENVKFKCLDAKVFHQVVKYYFSKPIDENDLIFYYEGALAKFLSPIENPFEDDEVLHEN